MAASKARASHLMRLYGITLEQYDELLQRQDHKCPVCLRGKEEFTTNLAVDHDHISGEIRGLLCNYCNHRLVGRHRDGSLLRRIADYIEIGTGWFVPPKKKRRRKPRKAKPKNGSTTRSKDTTA
jgi:hypothetical protein